MRKLIIKDEKFYQNYIDFLVYIQDEINKKQKVSITGIARSFKIPNYSYIPNALIILNIVKHNYIQFNVIGNYTWIGGIPDKIMVNKILEHNKKLDEHYNRTGKKKKHSKKNKTIIRKDTTVDLFSIQDNSIKINEISDGSLKKYDTLELIKELRSRGLTLNIEFNG